MKAINTTAATVPAEIRIAGRGASGTAKVMTLESADLNAENSFDHPKAISPQNSTVDVKSGTIAVQLRPYSANVYRISMQ